MNSFGLQPSLYLYFSVTYFNSLTIIEHYPLSVSVKLLVPSDLIIGHSSRNYMDLCCLCFYSLITSNWHTILLMCLHLIAQLFLMIFLY